MAVLICYEQLLVWPVVASMAQNPTVIVAIVRKRLGLELSLYQILQILSVTLFEKTPILQALQTSGSNNDLLDPGNQLILFDF